MLDEEDEPEESATTIVKNQDPEPTDLDQFCQDFPVMNSSQVAFTQVWDGGIVFVGGWVSATVMASHWVSLDRW